jgi:hypothetical protein
MTFLTISDIFLLKFVCVDNRSALTFTLLQCTLHFALKAPPIICMSTSWSFPHSWSITRFVTRLTRQVPLVEQEIPTLPEHPSTPLVFSGVRVTRSLVLCVCFVDLCLSFCPFSFGHCVVCLSTIYRFRLPF